MAKLDDAERKRLMARFKARDTHPELLVRRALHRAGRRFSLHVKVLPGRPDIVMRKDRTVIMVNGCFWHAHEGCPVARTPKTNSAFWEAKFAANRQRDIRVRDALAALGWTVIIIWECEARSTSLIDRLREHRVIGV